MNIKRSVENGKRIITVFDDSRCASIQMKNPCCLKYLEPTKGKCTGCPYLDEEERIQRLVNRLKNLIPNIR